jgi:NADH:ubiquinone oxidoreductase subunit E
MSLSDLQGQAGEIVRLYEHPKAAMLPLLWLVQEHQGYISPEAEAWVGRIIGVSIAHVREVVSFYNMFHTRPVGRRELRVCASLPCVLRGPEQRAAFRMLNIAPGETTQGEVTVTEVECQAV